MNAITIRITGIKPVTHDVLQIRTVKPAAYNFIPGQATEVAINKPGWEKEARPFTFTSLPSDDYLEFTIKSYPAHQGVTARLKDLVPGDELIIHDSWGAISYKGPGLFIAGGAGVTPFLSIFRQLQKDNRIDQNRLLFANKMKEDIIHEAWLTSLLGPHFIPVLSDETVTGYRHGFISKELLEEVIPAGCSNFYVCGPPPMMDSVMKSLGELGVAESAVTVEI